MRRPDSIQSRMHRLVFIFCAVLAAVMISMLVLLLVYSGQYRSLLRNVTTASEFNQDFKETIDRRIGGYVLDRTAPEGLPISEVQAAQRLASTLLSTTEEKDSREAISGVLELCQELEEKMREIRRSPADEQRLRRLESSVYVLTARIQEDMYNYLYTEAVHLNVVQRRIAHQVMAEIVVFAAMAAALIVVMARYSVRLSRTVTQPIVELSRRAEDVIRGDLTVREPVRSDAREVRTLSVGMEEMIARLNALLHESREKQESLRKAELALLQAQINPHFLYNTLDTIMWLIEAGRTQAAVEMVSDLSDFFRHSLSRGKDVISLAEEARHVGSYLHIQHARYLDILDYDIRIDPSLGEAQVPKLTLQPLVENALYHGIKRKRGRGRIQVISHEEGGDILLLIVDDGAGMTPERLAQLRAALESGERVGFGLSTVHERLRLLFGPPYGLTLSSVPGEGSTITVRIPNTAKQAQPG